MRVLRLRQTAEGDHRYKILVELEDGALRRTDERSFTFELTPRDQEDLRWYMEDYLQYPLSPAPVIAQRIETRMDEIGADLFRLVLHGTTVWGEVRNGLSDTRVEIVTGVQEATAILWELLRDPDSAAPLALQTQAFVRATHNAGRRANLPQTDGSAVRVLLAICRPRGGADVPFRSVAVACSKAFAAMTPWTSPSYALPLSSASPPFCTPPRQTAARSTWSISMATASGPSRVPAKADTDTWSSRTPSWTATAS